MVKSATLVRHSLQLPECPARSYTGTPAPSGVDKRTNGHRVGSFADSETNALDDIVDCRTHPRSDSRASATYSQIACASCGTSYRVLRDHVVLLRTQLQAQYKAAQAEARMRQLHSNAIEFLLKEVRSYILFWRHLCFVLPCYLYRCGNQSFSVVFGFMTDAEDWNAYCVSHSGNNGMC